MIGQYLDFQAMVGITKHMGGLGATRELLRLCRVDEAREVLEVGCGIGVGPANLAREHGCRVVGVDRSERMIEWARRRAREHGVADSVELVVADVMDTIYGPGLSVFGCIGYGLFVGRVPPASGSAGPS